MEDSSLAKRLRPKTYSIALYLVGIVLVLQVTALVSVFYFRHVIRVDTKAPPLPPHAFEQAAHHPSGEPAKNAPTATISTQPSSSPDRILPFPGSGRLAVRDVQNIAQRVKALNEEADRFEVQGDLRLAALALFKAESLDPKDPVTLVGLAKLFSAEKDYDKSRLYWQRVVALGSGTGNTYMMAKEQLALTEALQSRSTALANDLAVTGTDSSPTAPPPAPASNRILFVDRIDKTLASGNEFSMKIILGTGGVSGGIQPDKVVIKLYFYDQQASGAIVPSKAQIKVNFAGARQSWENGQSETLLASYWLSPEMVRAYGQKYFGYMLRIYYDGKLQDERAEPQTLLKFFPAT